MVLENNKNVMHRAVFCLISISLISLPLMSASKISEKEIANQKNLVNDLQQLHGKKLNRKEMDLLSEYLALSPTAIIRMDKVCQAAIKVARELQTARVADEKSFCAQQIKFIMSPVEQFFGLMSDVTGIVKPLIEESLHIEGSTRGINSSFILDYFDSKMGVDEFFNTHVTTKQQLMNACTEFIIFFKDLKASLSEKALKAYNEMCDKIKKNQNKINKK